MLFSKLLASLEVCHTKGELNTPITGIAYDSRKVKPGYLFVAIAGFVTDGHNYIDQAIENGAAALIVEKETAADIPLARVKDSRLALALAAAAFYNYPAKKLLLTGVTGTNGKTTTSHLIAAIYKGAGNKVGLVGTIQNIVGGKELPAVNTTPESLDLQRLLAQMVKSGVTHAAMEVSSHALALNRVAATDFAAAVFTNLTQDHLDFHGGMDDYAAAKAKLFAMAPLAVINIDDAHAQDMIKAACGKVVTYGLRNKADVSAKNIKLATNGVSFVTTGKYGECQLQLKLTGEFNVYNALAAFACTRAQGIDLETVSKALEAVPGVAGRFELVKCGQPFGVVVDYAHTPDGLENVLQAARRIARNRVIAVFGCGGDRDRTKRPIMGELGVRLSEHAVITSDNPRTEDPMKIIDDILVGVKGAVGADRYTVVPDRREAIYYAINKAEPGDVVVIAGKGHETYQIIGKTKYDFDDRVVATEALQALGYTQQQDVKR